MTAPLNALRNFITTMAVQSSPLIYMARDNPFFFGNVDKESFALRKFTEDLVYDHTVPSSVTHYYDFCDELNGVSQFQARLAKTASTLEGHYATRAQGEISTLGQLISAAKEANARLPRHAIDTSTESLPDLKQGSQTFMRLRRFLVSHISLAQLALVGRNPERIYFDLDPAEIAFALGLSTFSS
jgi:hypothetical protein